MHALKCSRRELIFTPRLEVAERLNKNEDERLNRHLRAIDETRVRQVARVKEERRQLQQELQHIRHDTTPSLEDLTLEIPPDMSRTYLLQKRHSLPCLRLTSPIVPSQDGMASRRYSSVAIPTDFQKRMSDFLGVLEQMNSGETSDGPPLSEEEGDTSTDSEGLIMEEKDEEELQDEEGDGAGMCRKDMGPTLEEALNQVRNCRYLRHRIRPEMERELSPQEIFAKEESECEDSCQEPPGNLNSSEGHCQGGTHALPRHVPQMPG
ncbi:uncharacterized protein LOC120541509 [Polypterus senegalus]|uniref:uncharacterized protein LOC120541509 n=1 Tax=Polypterus senegalus TaxID=55291 RepID=UPI00196520C6|nr:uncharacterized protein LOC120541509 [Polypterus senegalus]